MEDKYGKIKHLLKYGHTHAEGEIHDSDDEHHNNSSDSNFSQEAKGDDVTFDKVLIQGIIDELWVDYDHDKNGSLDKEECKNLLEEAMLRFGMKEPITDEHFMEIFNAIDTDGS